MKYSSNHLEPWEFLLFYQSRAYATSSAQIQRYLGNTFFSIEQVREKPPYASA